MSEVWDRYPAVASGLEIHLTPRGGTVFLDDAPVKVPPAAAVFLSQCNGRQTLREVLPSAWQQDWEDVAFIGFTAQAANAGWLSLSELPSPHAPRVTGSRTAFYPPHMSIELTEGCNLRCDYCYRGSDSSKLAHMPTERLLGLLGKLREGGLRSVELTGGEPLLHRDFRRILEFCAQHFAMVGVLSNGTLVDERLAQQFAAMGEKLIFSVSLDASTAPAHDARRGVAGSWERTTRGIARLAELGVGIRVSMVVDERNFDDLENTLLLARSLGARAFSYSPLLPLGRGRELFNTVWSRSGEEVFAREADLAQRYKGFLGVLSEESVCEVEGEEGCGAGYRTFGMDPWGNVRPCATFGAQELVFGNLLTQSMEEVFGHPAVFAMNRLRTPSPAFCVDCRHFGFCRYCSLRGLHASGSQPDCAWRSQPALEEVLRLWRDPGA